MSVLTLACPESTVHETTAAVVMRVLEANDCDVRQVTGSRDDLIQRLMQEEIDLFVSAWLPDIDADMLAYGVTPLGDLFKVNAYCCLCNETLPLSSLADIASKGENLSRNITTPLSLQKTMEKVLHRYELDKAGFTLHVLPDSEALTELSAMSAENQPVLIPLFYPCYLFYRTTLKPLSDPLTAMGKEQTARILIRKNLLEQQQLDQDMLDELEELMLSAKIITAMDYAIHKEGLTAHEAAEAWQRGKLLIR